MCVLLQKDSGQASGGPGAMRFAAHFALALRALGLVAEPSWEEDQYDPLQVRSTRFQRPKFAGFFSHCFFS